MWLIDYQFKSSDNGFTHTVTQFGLPTSQGSRNHVFLTDNSLENFA
jgi:hypothetical protein